MINYGILSPIELDEHIIQEKWILTVIHAHCIVPISDRTCIQYIKELCMEASTIFPFVALWRLNWSKNMELIEKHRLPISKNLFLHTIMSHAIHPQASSFLKTAGICLLESLSRVGPLTSRRFLLEVGDWREDTPEFHILYKYRLNKLRAWGYHVPTKIDRDTYKILEQIYTRESNMRL